MFTAEKRARKRAGEDKWRGKPPGLPTGLARKFEREINRGLSIKDLTSSAQEATYLASNARFRAQCRVDPAWGKRIEERNQVNVNKKKSVNSLRALNSRDTCLRGLHKMWKAIT
jgi:hypothetical protein